jgi:hypothetical protein
MPTITADLPETATRKVVERWRPSTLSLFIGLKTLETLTKLGIVPKEDAWRKWTRAFHRGEEAKMVLPVFRLTPCSDLAAAGRSDLLEAAELRGHAVSRLASFFRTERELLSRRLDWRRGGVRVVDNAHVDIVAADFDGEGKLVGITPHFKARRQRPGTWPH